MNKIAQLNMVCGKRILTKSNFVYLDTKIYLKFISLDIWPKAQLNEENSEADIWERVTKYLKCLFIIFWTNERNFSWYDVVVLPLSINVIYGKRITLLRTPRSRYIQRELLLGMPALLWLPLQRKISRRAR